MNAPLSGAGEKQGKIAYLRGRVKARRIKIYQG